jgi:hypothetical protein
MARVRFQIRIQIRANNLRIQITKAIKNHGSGTLVAGNVSGPQENE